MRFRIFICVLAVALGPILYGQSTQDLLQTTSGPFWEHRINVGELDNGCSVMINGMEVKDTSVTLKVPGPDPNATFSINLICHTQWGYANLQGTLILSKFPMQTPILYTPGFEGNPLSPMPTHALFYGPLQVTPVTDPRWNAFDMTAKIVHGASTGGFGSCGTNSTGLTNQQPGQVSFTVSTDCDNQNIIVVPSDTPHDFGDGYKIAEIGTTAILTVTLRGSSGGGPQVTQFNIGVTSVYKISGPKLQLDKQSLTLTATAGALTTDAGAFLRLTNTAGGLLGWTFGGGVSGKTIGTQVKGQPDHMNPNEVGGRGLGPGEFVDVIVSVITGYALGFQPNDVQTGTVSVNPQNGVNHLINVPITVNVGSITDDIKIQSISPPPGNLDNGSYPNFQARASYTLGSQDSAKIQLEVTQPDGTLLTSSPSYTINRVIGAALMLAAPQSYQLQTTSDKIYVAATLRDSSGKLLMEDSRTYFINQPVTQSSIQITSATPAGGTSLAVGTLPKIQANVTYAIANSWSGAQLYLKLSDTPDHVITSDTMSLPATPRNGQTTLTMLNVNIPAKTPPLPYTLVAVIRDPASGTEITSAPVQYNLAGQVQFNIDDYRGVGDDGSEISCSNPRTLYFCEYPSVGDSTSIDTLRFVPIKIYFTWDPPISGGAITVTLTEWMYKGGQRSTRIGYFDVPADRAQAGVIQKVFYGLSPAVGVYKWRWDATLATDAGQSFQAKPMDFEIQSLSIEQSDVDGYTPQQIQAASIPGQLCAKMYYNNPTSDKLRAVASTIYLSGSFTDPIPQSEYFVDTGEHLDGTRICHDVSTDLLSQGKGAQLLINLDVVGNRQPQVDAKSFSVVSHIDLPPGTSQVKAPPLTLGVIFNQASRATDAKPVGQGINAISDVTGIPSIVPQAKTSTRPRAVARPQDVIGINSGVRFDPPIPDDGTFMADLTYAYDPSDFLDDPNFQESKLQLVSYDPATGLLETYPSTVDTVNHAVTARVSKLPPFVSVGVAGPFPGETLSTPASGRVFGLGLSLVNMGKNPAQLQAIGNPAPSSSTPIQLSLGPGQQMSSTGTALDALLARGWFQAQSDQAGVRGVALLAGGGGAVDALPLGTSASAAWVLTGVETDNGVMTEVLLANTSNFDAQVTLELVDPSGNAVDTEQRTIMAKGVLDEAVGSLFPAAPQQFRGYILVQSSQRLAAARVWTGGTALTALNGQLPGSLGGGARHYVVPFVGGGGTVSRVNLVNPGSSDVNVTLTAKALTGAALGQPLNVTVGAGTQYWGDIGSLFPVPPGTITPGSLFIDSSSGVMGDISFGESHYRLWSSLALTEPATSLLIPVVSNQKSAAMGVVATNAGSSATNVTLHVLGADGTETGSAKWTIPPGGLTYDLLTAKVPASDGQTGGYLRLDCDQPASAIGLVGTLTQLNDIAAIQGVSTTGSSSSGMPTGGGTPTISVTPPNWDFGSVPVGQPATKTVTITNAGGGTLTVNSLSIPDNPQFTIVQPPPTPGLNVPATGLTITVQFTPTAATAGTLQKGTLTIGSNDPANGTLTVPLTGTGTSSSGGPPGGCLTPPANLVSWWTGDGNANDSAGGNNGMALGATTFAAGEVGQAFQFDGNTGYVNAGTPASMNFTSALTVEAWINPNAAPAKDSMEAVLTKWAQIFNPQADADSYGLWFRNDSALGLTVFGAIHQAGTNEPHVLGGTIPLNTWTHVAMTFDAASGNMVAYVNGQAVNSLNSPGAIVTSTRNVFIGREDSILPRQFNGLIDELSVYNRALSAAEIQAIYNAGTAGKCKGTSTGGGGLSANPANVDFGSSSTAVTKTVTLKNTGGTDITINTAPITPAGSPFSLVTPLPFTVPANGQKDIMVSFTPGSSTAPQSATLAIGSLNIPLTGTAVASTGGGSGMIRSITIEAGQYSNGTFTPYLITPAPNCKTSTLCDAFDTDDSTSNGALGVATSLTAPLLNNQPNKALRAPIAPGSYYTFNTASFTWSSHARVTVAWTNGVTDVAYFGFAGFDRNGGPAVWPNVGGATNLSLTGEPVNPCRVQFQSTQPPAGCEGNEVFLLTITSSSGTPTGGTPQISVTPPNWDFGSTPIGQPATRTVTITNAGGGTLTVNSLSIPDNPQFTIVQPPATPFNVPATGQPITVQFNPIASTAGQLQKGTLTIGSNDPANPTLTVPLTGTGTTSPGGTTTSKTLSVDGGTFATAVGLPAGATDNIFVNRLTPSGYPATLRQVQVVFSFNNGQTALPAGTPIKIVAAANPSGNSNINSLTLARTSATVSSGGVNMFSIPPITLQTAGDFVVGFELGYPAGTTPAVLDVSSPPQLRSYFSADGATFTVLDANSGVPGNLGIRAVVDVPASGGNPAPSANVLVSDSFNRANAGACALGQADMALGGSGTHYYLPIFPGSSGPIGAGIVSGALQNNGMNFGGVQLTGAAGACTNLSIRGETLPQDLNIGVDLVVPKTGSNVTQAGPYFRSRAAAAGDGIIGGASAGYWVELISTGEVRVIGLNPFATIASTGVPASFDSTVKHTLQVAAKGLTLQVALDGKVVVFPVGIASVATLTLPASGGSNDGTVGISFGSTDNSGLAGGQRASNLVISGYAALTQ